MCFPIFPIGLLVQIHAHNQWTAERFGDFYEFNPTRVLTKNIADYQGFAFGTGKLDQFLALFGTFGQWFFLAKWNALIEEVHKWDLPVRNTQSVAASIFKDKCVVYR